jgi:hypothetical protein
LDNFWTSSINWFNLCQFYITLEILVFPNWSLCWIVHFKVLGLMYLWHIMTSWVGILFCKISPCRADLFHNSPHRQSPIVLACIDHYSGTPPWQHEILIPQSLKLDEEKSKHTGLAQEIGCGSATCTVSGGWYDVQRVLSIDCCSLCLIGWFAISSPPPICSPCFSLKEWPDKKIVDN